MNGKGLHIIEDDLLTDDDDVPLWFGIDRAIILTLAFTVTTGAMLPPIVDGDPGDETEAADA